MSRKKRGTGKNARAAERSVSGRRGQMSLEMRALWSRLGAVILP